LLSSEIAVLVNKITAAKIRTLARSPDIFIRSAAPGLTAKKGNSFGDIFHHD